MAKNTLYDFDPVNPFAVVREQYTNVGTGRNILGDIKRGFPGGTEFEIWDAAELGNQLVDGVDYELLTIDRLKSREAGYDIYTEYRILNPAYQAGNIYITYKIVHSYISADTINKLIADVDILMGSTVDTTDDNYTFLDNDNITILALTGSVANRTFTLPTLADNLNRVITILNLDAAFELTVDGEGAETIDGMTTIELPKQYNRIKIIGGPTEWNILEEAIDSELYLDTYAAFGGVDTKIPQFTNVRQKYGNCFTENHSTGYNGGSDGLEITCVKPGKYSVSFTFESGGAAAAYWGISLNSAQLATNIHSINVQNRCCLAYGEVGGIPITVAIEIRLETGDILRPHTTGAAPNTAAHVHIIINYIGP